ncbi:MAG: hypothetical protein HY514_00875 [Candidatus Aenigmarchaeota archaeon]|nr:hypothetical protein [Candidatus Aenigmarchaeota archaeon]
MTYDDWRNIARDLLRDEKKMGRHYPMTMGVLVEWQRDTYLACIKEIAPAYSREVVLLRKGPDPMPDELIDAIIEKDPERLQLYADDSLNLNGAQHVLRRLGNVLACLTREQSDHVRNMSQEMGTTTQ